MTWLKDMRHQGLGRRPVQVHAARSNAPSRGDAEGADEGR